MKKFILIAMVAMMFSSCGIIYDLKASTNQVNYMSISGKTGTLVLHTYEGDVILKDTHIDYVGIENDDLFYTYKGMNYYYSGPCSFSW